MSTPNYTLNAVYRIMGGYKNSIYASMTSMLDLVSAVYWGLTDLAHLAVAHTDKIDLTPERETLVDACHATFRIAELRKAHLDLGLARHHINTDIVSLALDAGEAHYGSLRIFIGDEPYDALEYDAVVIATTFANAAYLVDTGYFDE